MTSREDPFPLVNLEAAISGVPIICFEKSGGSPEIIDDSSGFVVPYGDTQEMSSIILEVKKSPKKYVKKVLIKKSAKDILAKLNRFFILL